MCGSGDVERGCGSIRCARPPAQQASAVVDDAANVANGRAHWACGPENGVCEGKGVYSASRVATLNKYGAARTGANLLEVARPALFDTSERAAKARAPSRGFVL